MASLSAAATALAYDAAAVPSRELRGRILEAARAERETVVPIRRASPAWSAAVAVAAILALGVGVWAIVGPGGRELPQPVVAKLRGTDGTLQVDPSGHGWLALRRLDPAPAGKAYEVWVIAAGRPVEAGLFARGGQRLVVSLTRTVPRHATVAVTLERAGGVAAPTTPVLFSATI